MGLFKISGTITATGQNIIGGDGQFFQWIEITDTNGQRFKISKVAAENSVLALVNPDASGDFFFENTGFGKKRIFGIKLSHGPAAFSTKNFRIGMGMLNIMIGLPLLAAWGLGIFLILFGLYQILSPNRSARETMFYGSDPDEARRVRQQVPVRI